MRNGGRTWNMPHHEPEKWELYKEYNRQDVVAEMSIKEKLEGIKLPKFEWKLWHTDIRMNAEGIKVDSELVESALFVSDTWNEYLLNEARKITGLENPNSTVQLLKWLAEKGVDAENLQKETVKNLIRETEGDVKRVLEIRQELSKTSTKKYVAMKDALCED